MQMSYELKKSTTQVLDAFRKGQGAFISEIQLQAQTLLQLYDSQRKAQGFLGIPLGAAFQGAGALQSPEDAWRHQEPISTNALLNTELRILIIESYILESLSFATMMERREAVEHAHARTFNWIYKDAQAEGVSWSSFVSWLRHGNGIYWINGKYGSGKSTLMRHLFENKTTLQELRVWAGQRPVELYGFFFWISGDDDQKSLVGLFKSLLFEILQRHRDLMPVVMASVWDTWSARAQIAIDNKLPLDSSFLPPGPDPFTGAELEAMLERVLLSLEETTKLCFLIDGLDEYGGDYADIVGLFKRCAASANIKLCLSSRPLEVFELSFEGLPTLKLQDLTHNDLGYYVRDHLSSQPRMQHLPGTDTSDVSVIIHEAVTKSEGVFLWIKLATRLLVDDVSHGRRIADLGRKVHSLPNDLEDLFAFMLAQKDYIHASRILQIFQRSWQQAPPKTTLLRLSWADEEERYVQEAPMERITTEEVAFRCQAMDQLLQSVCAGLLEAKDGQYSSIAPDGKVTFLHRTVSDWVAQQEVWDTLCAQTANTGFSASRALLQSCILHLKSMDVTPSRPFDMGVIHDALEHAKAAEAELGSGFPVLLDQLDHAAAYQWRMGDYSAAYGGNYDDDDESDGSDDTITAGSDRSASPTGTPTELTPYLETYRDSIAEDLGLVFGSMDLADAPGRAGASSGFHSNSTMNAVSASYMAHQEVRYGGRTRDAPRSTGRSRRRVAHPVYHWTFGLEIPELRSIKRPTNFLDVAQVSGLVHYVAAKESAAAIQDQDVGYHMLMRAVAPPTGGSHSAIDPERVEALLSGGTNPNFAYEALTPWEAALAAGASRLVLIKSREGSAGQTQISSIHRQECESWLLAFHIFLEFNADPYAVAKVQDLPDRPVVSLCTILDNYVPACLEETSISLMELLTIKRNELEERNGYNGASVGSIGIPTNGTSIPAAEWPMSWIPIRKRN